MRRTCAFHRRSAWKVSATQPSHETFAELSALRTSETAPDESRTRPTPMCLARSRRKPRKTGPENRPGQDPKETNTRGQAPKGPPQQQRHRRNAEKGHEGPGKEHHRRAHARTHTHKHPNTTRTQTDTRKPGEDHRKAQKERETPEPQSRRKRVKTSPTRGVVKPRPVADQHGRPDAAWTRLQRGCNRRWCFSATADGTPDDDETVADESSLSCTPA